MAFLFGIHTHRISYISISLCILCATDSPGESVLLFLYVCFYNFLFIQFDIVDSSSSSYFFSLLCSFISNLWIIFLHISFLRPFNISFLLCHLCWFSTFVLYFQRFKRWKRKSWQKTTYEMEYRYRKKWKEKKIIKLLIRWTEWMFQIRIDFCLKTKASEKKFARFCCYNCTNVSFSDAAAAWNKSLTNISWQNFI